MIDDVSPNATPVLDNIASVVVKVVSMSRPCRDRITEEMKNTPRYVKINVVIPVTRDTDMELSPSFTATTERGWIRLMQPRQISFIMTMIRTTLIEPEVEAAHPPINRRTIMIT